MLPAERDLAPIAASRVIARIVVTEALLLPVETAQLLIQLDLGYGRAEAGNSSRRHPPNTISTNARSHSSYRGSKCSDKDIP